MNWSRKLFLSGAVALMILESQGALAQVAAGALTWQRELGVAMAEARKSGKGILAFFANPKSDASNKSWSGLYDSSVVPLIRSSYIPLLVDWESQKSLAAQLGVAEPGVAVIYDASGAAVRMLAARDILDRKTLEEALRSSARSSAAAAAQGAGTGAGPYQTPDSGFQVISALPPVPTRASAPSAATSSTETFPDAIPADQVSRQLLGQEIAVNGTIVVFEASDGPRIPFIATLTQRVTDPVEVVYWAQTAGEIHTGRTLPKRGDRISVRGKLTDYKGRLQIKVNSPRQIRLR